MKRIGDCLPASLRPESKCPLCAAGEWRFGDRHVRLSEKGEKDLGPCTKPPTPAVAPAVAPTRTHDEALALIREKAHRASVVSVLGHGTYATHSQPPEREPGEDDE